MDEFQSFNGCHTVKIGHDGMTKSILIDFKVNVLVRQKFVPNIPHQFRINQKNFKNANVKLDLFPIRLLFPIILNVNRQLHTHIFIPCLRCLKFTYIPKFHRFSKILPILSNLTNSPKSFSQSLQNFHLPFSLFFILAILEQIHFVLVTLILTTHPPIITF